MEQPTTDDLRRDWGIAVRARRGEMKLSQGQLADDSGVRTYNISAIERGKMLPSDKTRMALAKALKIEVHELFAYPPVPEAAAS